MGRPKGSRNKKDKLDSLNAEFRDAVAASTPEQIRDRIAEIALNQEALMKAKELDEDLKNLKAQVLLASEKYRDGTKENRLKIQFCRRVLKDMGKDAGYFEQKGVDTEDAAENSAESVKKLGASTFKVTIN